MEPGPWRWCRWIRAGSGVQMTQMTPVRIWIRLQGPKDWPKDCEVPTLVSPTYIMLSLWSMSPWRRFRLGSKFTSNRVGREEGG